MVSISCFCEGSVEHLGMTTTLSEQFQLRLGISCVQQQCTNGSHVSCSVIATVIASVSSVVRDVADGGQQRGAILQ